MEGFHYPWKLSNSFIRKKGENYIYPYKDNYSSGFSKSSLEEADCLLKEDKGDTINELPEDCICCYDVYCPRHDKDLVAVVEELGKEASGSCADLVIAEIPGNIYRIDEYDGYESIETPDSMEWITIQ